MVVAHDGGRGDAGGGQRPAEERLGGRRVPVVAEEDVEHLAVLVDGPVEVALLLAPVPEEEHFVDVPVVPGRRRCLRTSAASSGPKVCTQRRTVRLETSIPRSARNTITLVAESGWPRYQRTAIRITSGGQRYPEKADAECAVNVRRQGRHTKR